MKPYQEEYLELLRSAAQNTVLPAEYPDAGSFADAAREAGRSSLRITARGTQLLREELFPVLDNILSASEEEILPIEEFAAKLAGPALRDSCLDYRIHLALMTRARHLGDRDMLIRELYMTAMPLYYLENMLSPNRPRLYTTRMRMYFAESASYFDTQYDEIQNPETRGYIHRSMGNIALAYDTADPRLARAKLDAVSRSIAILSDPEIRAKTPSLPWDTYLYKSHQERTSLLSFLRTGTADPDAFAKVLESAQIVQDRQLAAARERGEAPQPRWQYAYMAARYHCGAMLLPELLDGLYALSTARPEDDMGTQSMFCHVSIPAVYLTYSEQLRDGQDSEEVALRVRRMTRRLCSWIVRLPAGADREQLMFFVSQLLYSYRELPGAMPFSDLLQNIFAACCPSAYARMWIVGQIAGELAGWAAQDCPETFVGLRGFRTVSDVVWNREELVSLACLAGRFCDAGMIHFFRLETSACRGLFEEEEALIRLHSHCGAQMLGRCPSTAVFADVARGHHCFYDEKNGFPSDFSPSGSPVHALIYLAAAADTLASASEETSSRFRPMIPFDEACALIREERGTRYAPFAAALLDSPERRETLRRNLESWKQEAYFDLYRRRAAMRAEAEHEYDA